MTSTYSISANGAGIIFYVHPTSDSHWEGGADEADARYPLFGVYSVTWSPVGPMFLLASAEWEATDYGFRIEPATDFRVCPGQPCRNGCDRARELRRQDALRE